MPSLDVRDGAPPAHRAIALHGSRLFGSDDGVASVARAELEQDVCDVALDGSGLEGQGGAQFVGC